MVLFTPPVTAAGESGAWRIEDGSLQVEGVDFYVDMRGGNAVGGETVLFDLIRSDVGLIDCTITVVGATEDASGLVTAVRLFAGLPLNNPAAGAPPAPAQAKFERCLFRGTETVLSVAGGELRELDGMQAEIKFVNCLAAGPGSLVSVVHTRSAKYAQEQLSLNISACTLDLGGPILQIDLGSLPEAPVRLDVQLTRTIVTAPTAVNRPWQVLLLGAGAEQNAAASLAWKGSGNAYFLRGDCLATRAAFGQPAPVLVSTPDDWAAQGLGQETKWWAGATEAKRGAWHERKASEYDVLRTAAGKGMSLKNKPDFPGADRTKLPTPRTLK
jgi:hypothetical protein